MRPSSAAVFSVPCIVPLPRCHEAAKRAPCGPDPATVIGSGRYIELSFNGIHPAIGASLTSRELSVFADWQGQTWDLLLSLDVLPWRARSGYICELCQAEERTIFPNLEALWRDHLFEPLLTWVNTRLAMSDALDLYGSPSSGSTHAELLSRHDTQGTTPNIRIPVRVLQYH